MRAEQHLHREVWIQSLDGVPRTRKRTARVTLAPGPHELQVRVVIRSPRGREERTRALHIDARPGATYVLHGFRDIEGPAVWVEWPGWERGPDENDYRLDTCRCRICEEEETECAGEEF